MSACARSVFYPVFIYYIMEGMRAIMIEGWVSDLILKGFLVAGGFAFITLSFAVISAKTATEKS